MLYTTLGGFILLYSVLLVVDIFLMTKYVRLGPDKALGPHNGHATSKPHPHT